MDSLRFMIIGATSDTSPGWLSTVGLVAIGVSVAVFVACRRRTRDRLMELATIDSLTGLKNRRQLDADLGRRIDGVMRPTAMLMIDVDRFTTFNDTHGHAAGDDVLRRVGDAIAANVRRGDVPYRFGGEAFCVLLPDATQLDARKVAERVRTAIELIQTPYGTNVTASVGVACGWSTDLANTVEIADQALVDAKRRGRNRVAVRVAPSSTDER